MSLRLLLDEDTQSRALVALLRQSGHDLLTVAEAGVGGAGDPQVLALAREEGRVLLTYSAADFLALHRDDPEHPGTIAIYRDRDAAENMSRAAIARALGDLESGGWSLPRQFVVLNAWRSPPSGR